MYLLHIANRNYSSWSLRPWLLLTELGIPFEERMHSLEDATSSTWSRFRTFAPNGKVPCLHDNGTVVWDSLAIVEYLAERHADVWPSATDARAWARCATAEMHAGFAALRNQCSMNCGLRIRLPDAFPEALKSDVARIDELWRDGLERFGGPFLAGTRFGAVDAFFAPVAFRVQSYGLTLGAAASEYAQRILALPGMRRWYAQALQESWRGEEHERQARKSGTVWQDLRLPLE